MNSRSRQIGIALVVVMMSLSLLAVVVLAISYLSNQSLVQSKLQAETDEAFFAAQGALGLKVAEVKSGDDTQKQGKMTDSDAHYDVKAYLSGENVAELSGFTVPDDHVYVVARGFDRDPAAAGPEPREVKLGALFKRTATVFNAAALAGDLLTVKDGAYTDTWDSSTGAPGNHALAHVGIYNPTGTVDIGSGSYVGFDGGSNALADVLVPTGYTGTVIGAAGSEYAAQTVSPFLTAPDPVPTRTPGTTDLIVSTSTTGTPTLVGGEYVLEAKDFKVESGAVFTLDVSGIPDGTTVYVDVNEFNMDGGRFEVYDDDVTGYGLGSASEIDVQVYCNHFYVKSASSFGTLNNEPRRMVAYSDNEMIFEDLATSYLVGRARTQIKLAGSSEVYGSLLGEQELLIQDASKVHYDENLQDVGSGATGGGALQFTSFQRL